MRILIFAGTHAQAVAWRLDHGFDRTQAEYVPNEAWLRGLTTAETPRVFIGTFWSRADAEDIRNALRVTDLF